MKRLLKKILFLVLFLTKYRWIRRPALLADRPVKLDLGCGSSSSWKGYIGIDLQPAADIVMHLGRAKLPFQTSTVDEIRSSHFFEHIEPHETEFLLLECARVLRPNGRIEIIVPSLEIFCQHYLNRDNDFFKAGNWPGETLSDKFNYIMRGMGHKWFFDADSLTQKLKSAGFSQVKVIDLVEVGYKASDVSVGIEAYLDG